MIFVKKIEPRNPFRLTKETLLTRAYQYAFKRVETITQEVEVRRRFKHGVRKGLFHLFWNLPLVPTIGQFRLELPDKVILLPFNSRNTQFHALYMKRYQYGYEPEVMAFLENVVSSRDIFYDIGANWGYFAFVVATKPGYQGHIHAFEPFPSAFKDLLELCRASGLEEMVRCHNLALSDYNGFSNISLKEDSYGIHSGMAKLSDSGKGDKVAVYRLDDFVPDEAPPPDILKIDAEGGEYQILCGGENLFRKWRPMVIFENCINSLDCIEPVLYPLCFLEKLGYRFFAPCWLVEGEPEKFLFSDNRALFRQDPKQFALKEFRPNERLLYLRKINCVAIPDEKVSRLEKEMGFSRIDV